MARAAAVGNGFVRGPKIWGHFIFDSVAVDELASEAGMATKWAEPQYTRGQIDAAGEILASDFATGQALEVALAIINNWRSSHSFPLNTFQMGLRGRAKQVDPDSLIAQRIKRLSSIRLKLKLLRTMKLSQMQDLGGCRAVVHSVPDVYQVVDLYGGSDLKHKLDHIDDYIRQPRDSGYRGVHLIYRYYSDKKTTYNGLKIEMQIRSPLQHAWATAVETVGTFIQQALKSSQGEEEWLRFFALMGTAIANRERTAPVPYTPTDRKELVRQLRRCANALDIERKLKAYGAALETLEEPGLQKAHYFLLALDPTANSVTITGYKFGELESASNEYLATERAMAGKPGADVVLVSVESLASLRRAYPNYFLDTSVFIDAVKRAMSA
ncbi:MAG TPA: RelA/SpoT domain-containing protein [Dehalococcoidia bacterium]|nr:RelA/SpoT domain-containing protein [Dehalococcoidia bacterium]